MCPAFSQFGCNFIQMLYIERDSTVICVPFMLEHVCYKPFSEKIAELEDISC